MQNNSNKHTSSDDLIDIQIEESLVRETLMLIDSSNCKEDLFTLICFSAALVLAIIIGLLGPPVESQTETHSIFSHESQIESFSFPFNGIAKPMRYAKIDVFFSKKVGQASQNAMQTSFSYHINCFSKSETVLSEHKSENNAYIIFNGNSQDSYAINLFSTNVIEYDKIVLDISIKNIDKSIGSLTARIITGSEQHTYFQLYVRTVYSVFLIIFSVIFLAKIFVIPIKYWHLEQKLTMPLMLITVIHNNPLYAVSIYFPSHVFVIFDKIIQALYQAYFNFFIYTLFDSLRYKNRKTDSCFFGPKIILCAILFIISVVHGVYDDINIFTDDIKKNAGVAQKLMWTEIGFTILLYGLSFISIIRAAFDIDITERYKLIIYIISSLTAMAFLFIADLIERSSIRAAESSIDFTTRFSVKNIFVMLMTYFHWPYELLNDQNYDESGTSNRPQDDFMLNADTEI